MGPVNEHRLGRGNFHVYRHAETCARLLPNGKSKTGRRENGAKRFNALANSACAKLGLHGITEEKTVRGRRRCPVNESGMIKVLPRDRCRMKRGNKRVRSSDLRGIFATQVSRNLRSCSSRERVTCKISSGTPSAPTKTSITRGDLFVAYAYVDCFLC